ncbi:MAG: hypothetical protein ABEJ98_02200 [Candidatus Nanohaloarchaea archaeon]
MSERYEVWIAVIAVTVLAVTFYSFDIDPSWAALLVVSAGVSALAYATGFTIYAGLATFLLGAVAMLYRRLR